MLSCIPPGSLEGAPQEAPQEACLEAVSIPPAVPGPNCHFRSITWGIKLHEVPIYRTKVLCLAQQLQLAQPRCELP